MPNEDHEFVDSQPLLEAQDWPALRARAEQEGYLFFRQLLPADELIAVRRPIFRILLEAGLLTAEGWEDGLVDLPFLSEIPREAMRLDIGVPTEIYHAVQRLEVVHRLPHLPSLINLYTGLFGEDVFVHPRHIIRMITPHPDMHPTPHHQDFPLIQGSEQTWTCWFPLIHCPREMGALTILRQSHHLGYVPIQPEEGAGNIAAQLCPSDGNAWVSGHFALGDMLTFPCFTIHRALKASIRDRVRLSFDVRYQPASQPIEAKSLLPHCELSWPEIYEGWKGDSLQYYWQKRPLRNRDWNPDLLQPSQRIC